MTERLYYHDSSLLEFDAEIVGCGEQEGRYYTILDKSAFYPTSGGQLHDTGVLNGVEIVDVIEAGVDQVRHISEKPVGRIGDTVHGIVDKDRRNTYRQMHTAQHILSQAFIRLYGYETVSVHLGQEYAAVELDAKQMSPEQIASAEQLAQDVIETNYPVEILFVEGDEAVSLPLRKIPAREGVIRVIKIGDFDWSACGGTHCNSTAEVAMLIIIGVEKIRGRSLVKFLTGRQAVEDYRKRYFVTNQLSRQLTCHVNDLVEKVGKLVSENNTMRKEINWLQKQLLPIQADELTTGAQAHGKYHLVCREVDFSDDRNAKQLAGIVADRINGVVLLLAGSRLFIAVSSKSGLDAGKLARQFCEMTDLKGGGSSTLAQIGGAEKGKMADYREVLENLLCNA